MRTTASTIRRRSTVHGDEPVRRGLAGDAGRRHATARSSWPIPPTPRARQLRDVGRGRRRSSTSTPRTTRRRIRRRPDDRRTASTASRIAASRRSCTSVPFTIGHDRDGGDDADYVGYGDPDGATARSARPTRRSRPTRRAPARRGSSSSPTAARCTACASTSQPELDSIPPAAPQRADRWSRPARRRRPSQFVAPGDDGLIGTVTGYEIRYRASDRDDRRDNFARLDAGRRRRSRRAPAGTLQTFERRSACCPRPTTGSASARSTTASNDGPIAVVQLTTADRADRRGRRVLRRDRRVRLADGERRRDAAPLPRPVPAQSTVLGELAVETLLHVRPAGRRRRRRVGAAARDRARVARADRRRRRPTRRVQVMRRLGFALACGSPPRRRPRRPTPGSATSSTSSSRPTDDLQIVAWLEDPAGPLRRHASFITQQTGTLRHRQPARRFDFNSGPSWPYGRRDDVPGVVAPPRLDVPADRVPGRATTTT